MLRKDSSTGKCHAQGQTAGSSGRTSEDPARQAATAKQTDMTRFRAGVRWNEMGDLLCDFSVARDFLRRRWDLQKRDQSWGFAGPVTATTCVLAPDRARAGPAHPVRGFYAVRITVQDPQGLTFSRILRVRIGA